MSTEPKDGKPGTTDQLPRWRAQRKLARAVTFLPRTIRPMIRMPLAKRLSTPTGRTYRMHLQLRTPCSLPKMRGRIPKRAKRSRT